MKYFLLFFLFFSPLFGGVNEWQETQLRKELNGCPLSAFQSRKLRKLFPKLRTKAPEHFFLVEISETGEISVNGAPPDSSNFARLLIRLQKKKSLPPCTFLYMRNGRLASKHANNSKHAIFVGSKYQFRKPSQHQITFIDDFSTVPRLGDHPYLVCWNAEKVYAEVEACQDTVSWSEKIPRLFWRGMRTDRRFIGPISFQGHHYRTSPRVYLHLLSDVYPSYVDARITNTRPFDVDHLYNIGLGEHIFGTATPPTHLSVYHSYNSMHPRVSIEKHMAYRYQIAMDGNHATNPGYAWRLSSKCLTFKQESPFTQWFYAGLEPWVHYVPVERFLGDLIEKIEWAHNHDEEAHQIALNARAFAEKHLPLEKFYEHAIFVIKEYAKRQAIADGKVKT